MLTVPFNVKVESTGLGVRYVAKSFTGARQEYTTKIEQALQIGDRNDAKRFARTWADKFGVPFSVWQGTRRVFRVMPH